MSRQKRECWNTTFEVALTLLERGWVDIDQLRLANNWRQAQAPRIGKLALLKGKLTMAQVFAVLGEQGIGGKMFGETAVELGYLNNGEVYELLLDQANKTPSLLESLVTQKFLTPQQAALITNQTNAVEIDSATEAELAEAA